MCLKHFQKQKDRLGQAAVLGVLSTIYFKNGDYQNSIENYKDAYDIYKDLEQIEEQITCLKGIGNCYLKLNKIDDACDLFLECSTICSDNNDIYNFLDCLGNLIYIHEVQEKWDVVFELYKKSLDAFRELGDNKGIIVSNFNLGILQKKNNESEMALKYFKTGTKLAVDANYVEYILKGLSYIGEVYFYQGKIKDAKNKYIEALRIAESVKAKNAIIQLKILLKSLGLTETDIKKELEQNKTKK